MKIAWSKNLQLILSILLAFMLIIQAGIIAALHTEYIRIIHAKCLPVTNWVNPYPSLELNTKM